MQWHKFILFLFFFCLGFKANAENTFRHSCDELLEKCLHSFQPTEQSLFSYYSNYSLDGIHPEFKRAVIVIHGAKRQPYDHFKEILEAAQLEGEKTSKETLIIAPAFKASEDIRKAGELFWTQEGWKQGDFATGSSISSFQILDLILQQLSHKEHFPQLRKLVIVGHSAGGQFTQRYAAGTSQSYFSSENLSFVVSNPSSYLYLKPERPVLEESKVIFKIPTHECSNFNQYKYGLEKLNTYMANNSYEQLQKNLVSKRITYLLGEKDTLQDEYLDKTCPARLQGDNRFIRGQNFFSFLTTFFPESQKWQAMLVVPEAGHDAHAVYTSTQGRSVIFSITQ